MTPRSSRWREYLQLKIDRNKFCAAVGLHFTNLQPGLIEAELEMKEMLEQQNGYLHGGVTSAVCDMVAGYAAYSMVEEGQQVFTVECKVSYYNPGISDRFYATGWVEKAGKRFHFCESEIYYMKGEEKVTVAKSSTTMAVIEAGAIKDKHDK
ncbi:MAG: PaaI family thioesterase [Bacteroidetes bacterium]|nr:PaaI family thioesterase [Bacteroidota bacterium]MBS1617400.1 PaaI family thioesterase [Bacteroidota bacterium]